MGSHRSESTGYVRSISSSKAHLRPVMGRPTQIGLHVPGLVLCKTVFKPSCQPFLMPCGTALAPHEAHLAPMLRDFEVLHKDNHPSKPVFSFFSTILSSCPVVCFANHGYLTQQFTSTTAFSCVFPVSRANFPTLSFPSKRQ